MPSVSEIATLLVIKMMDRAGVRVWEAEPELRQQITTAALEMAAQLAGSESTMALPDTFKVQSGTAKTIKSSGGDAAITLTSLANNAARQAVKLDLGATRALSYAVSSDLEIAATPTAGNVVELWWSPSSSATAATDNRGNASGADAAYTGYSSNIDASLKHCQFIGDHVCTAQATATVQKASVNPAFFPQNRYGSLIVYNKSGAALHSSATNMQIRLTPNEPVIED